LIGINVNAMFSSWHMQTCVTSIPCMESNPSQEREHSLSAARNSPGWRSALYIDQGGCEHSGSIATRSLHLQVHRHD
jgi:hypothetical protein